MGPTLQPEPVLPPKTSKKCETIAEEEEERHIPPAPPLKSLEEMRKAAGKLRVSTYPIKSNFGDDSGTDPPYQRTVFKTDREQSDPEANEQLPTSDPGESVSMAQWRTSNLIKAISKQLEGRQVPIGARSRDSLRRIAKAKRPSRRSAVEEEKEEEEEEEDRDKEQQPSHSIEADSAETEPPYDRLSRYRRESGQGKAAEGDSEMKRLSGEPPPDESRPRLPTNPRIAGRPLPNPKNQETDWKDVR